MKLLARLAFVLGALGLIGLIAYEGPAAVLTPVPHAAWILLWLVPLHFMPLLLDVLGWREVLMQRVRVTTLLPIACVRESLDRLLPVANIGGEIVGIRLLVVCGVSLPMATASVIVETLLTIVSLSLFGAVGVIFLFEVSGAAQIQGRLATALALALPVIVLVVLVVVILRRGAVFRRVRSLAARAFGSRLQQMQGALSLASLDSDIGQLLAHPGRLAAATGWQLAGLIAGAGETWLALFWLGHPVGLAGAIALESLTQVARHFLFVVPAGLGVQEAGLVGVGHLLGMPGDVALTLSLLKRMREVVFGGTSLLVWYGWEARRALVRAGGRRSAG